MANDRSDLSLELRRIEQLLMSGEQLWIRMPTIGKPNIASRVVDKRIPDCEIHLMIVNAPMERDAVL